MPDAHVIPIDDLIEHEVDDDCVCGPQQKVADGGWVVVHNFLDGRELKEKKDE